PPCVLQHSFFLMSSARPRDLPAFPTHALPICAGGAARQRADRRGAGLDPQAGGPQPEAADHHWHERVRDRLGHDRGGGGVHPVRDRKSTRLNSSHVKISYAVFCLKKKKKKAME